MPQTPINLPTTFTSAATLILPLAMLAACREPHPPQVVATETRISEPASDVVFPQQEPSDVYMQALAGGRLVLDGGCLRIDDGEGAAHLIVWPDSAERVEPGAEGQLGVRDTTTGAVVRVGDTFEIGGGGVTGGTPHDLPQPIPAQCAGRPYWMGSPGFHMTAPDSWRMVELSSPLAARLPPDMIATSIIPIDTQVDVFERPGLTLTFDYGALACVVLDDTPGYASHRFSLYTEQRRGDVIRKTSTRGEDQILQAVFAGIDGPRGVQPPTGHVCLTVTAECDTSRDCDVARAVLNTVWFEVSIDDRTSLSR